MKLSGWNGKGMYVFLVAGNAIQSAVNHHYNNPADPEIPVLNALYMKTATGELVPWLASQTDLLADDWCVVI